MRVLRSVPFLALATLVANCGTEPLTPKDEGLDPAFAVAGTDRPITGEMSGGLIFVWDYANAECPLTTVYDAWGTMSHLGNVYVHGSHCPPAGTVPYYSNGHVTFTAANGDQLVGEYDDPDPSTPSFDIPAPITIVSGTGRFAGASETIPVIDLVLAGEWAAPGVPIEPWYSSLAYEGTVPY